MWDITSGQCLHTLQGPDKHQSAVTSLQFTDNFVVTSSDDGTVKLWDLQTGAFVRNLVQLDSGGNGECFVIGMQDFIWPESLRGREGNEGGVHYVAGLMGRLST